jgi:hypothetical protein
VAKAVHELAKRAQAQAREVAGAAREAGHNFLDYKFSVVEGALDHYGITWAFNRCWNEPGIGGENVMCGLNPTEVEKEKWQTAKRYCNVDKRVTSTLSASLFAGSVIAIPFGAAVGVTAASAAFPVVALEVYCAFR